MSELNASGPSSVVDLARRTRLNRTTVYRLLSTLQDDGFAVYDKESGLFSLTLQVRELSGGLVSRDVYSQAAVAPMLALLRDVNWPSDFAVFDQGSIVVKETTHPSSPLSIHRAIIGKRYTLLNSSLGRALLAAASPELRRNMLEITAASGQPDSKLARDSATIAAMIAQVKGDGYASSVGASDARMSAIALPVRDGWDAIGSLNLIFFRSVMTPATAAARYLPQLKAAVHDIEAQLRLISRQTDASDIVDPASPGAGHAGPRCRDFRPGALWSRPTREGQARIGGTGHRHCLKPGAGRDGHSEAMRALEPAFPCLDVKP